MDEVSSVEAGEWLDEYGRVCKEGKVTLLLVKGVEGVSDSAMEEVGAKHPTTKYTHCCALFGTLFHSQLFPIQIKCHLIIILFFSKKNHSVPTSHIPSTTPITNHTTETQSRQEIQPRSPWG